MDHHYGVGANGEMEGFKDKYIIWPQAEWHLYPAVQEYQSGHDAQGLCTWFWLPGAAPAVAGARGGEGIGVELKESLLEPGVWSMSMGSWGEHLPYYENKVTLNKDKKDKWGLPTLDIDCEFKENEKKMREDMKKARGEMLEAAGAEKCEVI